MSQLGFLIWEKNENFERREDKLFLRRPSIFYFIYFLLMPLAMLGALLLLTAFVMLPVSCAMGWL